MNETIKTKREYYGVSFVNSAQKMILDDPTNANRVRTAIKLLGESRPDLTGDKTVMKLAAFICRSTKGSYIRDLVVRFCDMLEESHVCC